MVKQKPVINLLFMHQTLHDGYSFESSQMELVVMRPSMFDLGEGEI